MSLGICSIFTFSTFKVPLTVPTCMGEFAFFLLSSYPHSPFKLSSYGDVLTPFVGDKALTILGSEHEGGEKGIHDRDVSLLEQSTGGSEGADL